MSIQLKNDIVIVAAERTAIGNFNGSLAKSQLREISASVIRNMCSTVDINPAEVQQLIAGHVLTASLGQNTARQVAIDVGMTNKSTAYTVNQVCGSGMKAVMLGYQNILHQLIAERAPSIIIAGGHEMMSQTPHGILLRNRVGLGDRVATDLLIHDGLTDPFHNVHMGITAENIAKRYNITRRMQDEYAASSHQRAVIAQSDFDNEIVPIDIGDGKFFTRDECVRIDTSLEKLSVLKPAFLKNGGGTVTAGNASNINDGAAFLMLMSARDAIDRGIEPMARIVSFAEVGVEPSVMGIGPVPASKQALESAGWTVNDLDLIEVNEAFAAQVICVNNEMGWDTSKVNVNGGAIALGHPIGASGARILVTLIHQLHRRGGGKGIATLCVGGGMGLAMCVETMP